jgi:hypothetical protein
MSEHHRPVSRPPDVHIVSSRNGHVGRTFLALLNASPNHRRATDCALCLKCPGAFDRARKKAPPGSSCTPGGANLRTPRLIGSGWASAQGRHTTGWWCGGNESTDLRPSATKLRLHPHDFPESSPFQDARKRGPGIPPSPSFRGAPSGASPESTTTTASLNLTDAPPRPNAISWLWIRARCLASPRNDREAPNGAPRNDKKAKWRARNDSRGFSHARCRENAECCSLACSRINQRDRSFVATDRCVWMPRPW